MELMRSPHTHPLSFRHRLREGFRPFYNRSFLLGHDPFDEYPLLSHRRPLVNIKEREDVYELEMALPGYKKEQIKVHLEKDKLSISAEKADEAKDGDGYVVREYGNESFKRSFQLGLLADQSKIEARFEDGVLHLSIPRIKEETKPENVRNIPVQ